MRGLQVSMTIIGRDVAIQINEKGTAARSVVTSEVSSSTNEEEALLVSCVRIKPSFLEACEQNS